MKSLICVISPFCIFFKMLSQRCRRSIVSRHISVGKAKVSVVFVFHAERRSNRLGVAVSMPIAIFSGISCFQSSLYPFLTASYMYLSPLLRSDCHTKPLGVNALSDFSAALSIRNGIIQFLPIYSVISSFV